MMPSRPGQGAATFACNRLVQARPGLHQIKASSLKISANSEQAVGFAGKTRHVLHLIGVTSVSGA